MLCDCVAIFPLITNIDDIAKLVDFSALTAEFR